MHSLARLRSFSSTRSTAIAGILFLLAVLPSCGGNEYAPPPPPSVTVDRPEVRDVTEYSEFTGTTRAVESVKIRARVEGFLISMHFQPGDDVKKGDLLFIIDPEPFEVALESAKADLESNQAELDLAEEEYTRTRTMYDRQATSEIQLIKMRAQRAKARAAVAASNAAIHAAQLNIDYAHVKAPITGRVGRHLVDIGNLVGSSGVSTHLAEMVRYSPLYVYFYLSEREVLAVQERSKARRATSGREFDRNNITPVEIARANDKGFPYHGQVDYSALEVDSNTGTWEVRGVFENEGVLDEIIVPGTFVRVRLPIGEYKDALLVTESALGADQSGRYLLVVNDKNVVEQRRIEVGALVDGKRVIASGIRADDRVIVNGLLRARPGATVNPQSKTPPINASAPATTSAGS